MPKKKAAGKKKKAAGKKSAAKEVDPLSAESVQKRAELEIALLRSELAERRDSARQATYKADVLSSKVSIQEDVLKEKDETMLDVTSDLARQYKTMQSQLMAKIMELEDHRRVLEEQLDVTKRTLADIQAEKEREMREKNDIITQLTQRIQSMETSYESVLNEALDAMASKVEQARDKWELESFVVQQRNKDVLMEFGLSHVAF